MRTAPFRRIVQSRYTSSQSHRIPDAQIQTFDAPSRPRIVHSRPILRRELPDGKPHLLFYVGVGAVVVSVWGAFLLYTTNMERLSSSVVQQILAAVQSPKNTRIIEVLGEKIRPEPAWYMLGEPWIAGAINLLQGNVDVSFRVCGTKGNGTVYFSSIRKAKGSTFTVLRFKLISDQGEVLWLQNSNVQDDD